MRKLKERFRCKIFMHYKKQCVANFGPTTAQTASRPIPCICGVTRHLRTSRVRTFIAITLKYFAPLPSYVVHFMKRNFNNKLKFFGSQTHQRVKKKYTVLILGTIVLFSSLTRFITWPLWDCKTVSLSTCKGVSQSGGYIVLEFYQCTL